MKPKKKLLDILNSKLSRKEQSYLSSQNGDNRYTHTLHVDVVEFDETFEDQLTAAFAAELLIVERKATKLDSSKKSRKSNASRNLAYSPVKDIVTAQSEKTVLQQLHLSLVVFNGHESDADSSVEQLQR